MDIVQDVVSADIYATEKQVKIGFPMGISWSLPL